MCFAALLYLMMAEEAVLFFHLLLYSIAGYLDGLFQKYNQSRYASDRQFPSVVKF